MRFLPRIGITCDREVQKRGRPFSLLREDYAAAISDLGGVPVLLPALPAGPPADETLGIVDGLLITGGDSTSIPGTTASAATQTSAT